MDQNRERACKIGFNQPDEALIDRLKGICGSDFVHVSEEVRNAYGHDETEDLSFPPEVVVKPASAQQVSKILAVCNSEKIPVTPIGARTGLSGGALSICGGVGLSMERFNRILHIDEQNLQVTVEPGVITQVLQDAVAEKGMFYAPDPASRGSCFIGGNLAENSGGPRALKYGVTKDFVLNLEVVLPSGEIIWTGANTLKNSTGYNLTQLMVGSEGTLGVITKAVLKLLPMPRVNMLMLVPFGTPEKACEAVSAIFRAGMMPSVCEFMERDAILLAREFIGDTSVEISDDVQAHLLIEADGNHHEEVMKQCESIAEVVLAYDCGEILLADSAAQKERLWKLRRTVGEAVKASSVYKEEDTVVPRFRLPDLLRGVKEIGERYGFRSVCYGHAGDGNLHVNILKGDLDDAQWHCELPRAIEEIFELTVSLGGTLSGEHGIGFVQRNYMPIAFPAHTLSIMKGIKAVFDPNGIMNPGKIFPET